MFKKVDGRNTMLLECARALPRDPENDSTSEHALCLVLHNIGIRTQELEDHASRIFYSTDCDIEMFQEWVRDTLVPEDKEILAQTGTEA